MYSLTVYLGLLLQNVRVEVQEVVQVSVCCLTQGRITGQELRHYSSLRDVAARQLAAGQFPLVFRGICAPTLPVGCFGANLPAATAAAPTPPPAAEPPATGTQGSELLHLRAGPSNSSSQCTCAFLSGICCIPMLSCMAVCVQEANRSQLLFLGSQPLRPVQA